MTLDKAIFSAYEEAEVSTKS